MADKTEEKVQKRREVGEVVEASFDTLTDGSLAIPGAVQEGELLHLAFRRNAKCPICNQYIRALKMKQKEIDEARIKTVLVFYATEGDLGALLEAVKLSGGTDPTMKLYKYFAALRRKYNPFSDLQALKLFAQDFSLAGLGPFKGKFSQPTEFLIDHNGKIVAAHYNKKYSDSWSPDDLLQEANNARNVEANATVSASA